LDRIQSDPFAPPSKARLRVLQTSAGFSTDLFKNKSRCAILYKIYNRNIALADLVTRKVHEVITTKGYNVSQAAGEWSGAKGGDFRIDSPGQQVLQVVDAIPN
jgi:hypothetical protein